MYQAFRCGLSRPLAGMEMRGARQPDRDAGDERSAALDRRRPPTRRALRRQVRRRSPAATACAPARASPALVRPQAVLDRAVRVVPAGKQSRRFFRPRIRSRSPSQPPGTFELLRQQGRPRITHYPDETVVSGFLEREDDVALMRYRWAEAQQSSSAPNSRFKGGTRASKEDSGRVRSASPSKPIPDVTDSTSGRLVSHAEALAPRTRMVYFSESTPSAHPCATDGRSRRLKVSGDRDGSGIDRQEQRALPRFIAT
jgi:hypothetical protein